MEPLSRKISSLRLSSYQNPSQGSGVSSLCFFLFTLLLVVGCGFKSEVEVTLSCGKPKDPACRKALNKSTSPTAASPADLALVSIEPSGMHWIEEPKLKLSLSQDSTVQLFKDSECTQSVSEEVKLTAGERTITAKLSELGVVSFFGRAKSGSGEVGACTDLKTTYSNVRRILDPNPSYDNGFGSSVVMLTNGNVVITSPRADINGVTDAGAVYLFNGKTGALISTLHGSTTDDLQSVAVTSLTNGNYVVSSPYWDCQASLGCSGTIANVGAVTFGSGMTGITGAVTASKSLVGSTLDDFVGIGVTALTNGNYVVASWNWDCQPSLGCSGTITNVGAATLGSGTSGITGPVNASNSLVGSTSGDSVGGGGATALSNGNYVVRSPNWDCQASLGCSGTIANVGAVTFRLGTSGAGGIVNASNSVVGSTVNDSVGNTGVTSLTNGNYVIISSNWDCKVSLGCSGAATDVGAVTFGSGVTGVSGPVTISNSLVGSTTSDQVGYKPDGMNGVTALTNGNYVVSSRFWDCQVSLGCSGAAADVGAVTFGSGTSGVTGAVSSSNSLRGSTANDEVGSSGITVLTNGNYVVNTQYWDCQVSLGCSGAVANVGAVTFSSGTTGISGAVTTSNSLVGSTLDDYVGSNGVTALTNGNYVVASAIWDCQASLGCSGTIMNVGAATFGSGTGGITGPVNTSNSLVGSTASDTVGSRGAIALTNGNYVVSSPSWDCQASLGCSGTIDDVGAVTFGSGTTGISGAVTTSNSLRGSTAYDFVGGSGVTALTNGNYVVSSPAWDCQTAFGCSGSIADVGGVTFGSGINGVRGAVTATNSLIGSTASDYVGADGVTGLANGNYLVRSSQWDCSAQQGCSLGKVNAGISITGNGQSGSYGQLSSDNGLSSLIGNYFMSPGLGHYLVFSSSYGPLLNAGLGLLVPSNAVIRGNMYQLQGDTDNDGYLDGVDPAPYDVKRNSGIDTDGDGWDSGIDVNDADNKKNTGTDADSDGWDSGSDPDDSNLQRNSGIDTDGDGWDSGSDTDDNNSLRNSGVDGDGDGYDSGSDTDDGNHTRNTGIDNDGDGIDSGSDSDDNDPGVR